MKPIVSISCITYNHEPYIRKALDSFLMQRDVPFEILIHDDASTDRTGEIIREYAAKYPAVIRPVLETENQYSKGISNISGVFNFPRAEGRYIAMCEGDDYWTDCYKLKKQTEYMDMHPDCALAAHSAKILSENQAFHSQDLIRPFTGSHELSAEESISRPVNLPMASLLFPAEYAKELPSWYFDCPVGDIPLQLFLLTKGYFYYADEPMSVYRTGGAGSWQQTMDAEDSAETASSDGEKKMTAAAMRWEEHYRAMEKLYRAFDGETGGKYREFTGEALQRSRFLIDLKEGKFEAVKKAENRKFLSELGKTEAKLLKLRASAPALYRLLQKTYHAVKS